MTYPSISFKTTKRYPIPSAKPWRDSIAIVGEFSKGPAEVLKVTNDDFDVYFGADNSDGAANVQQALELGASNIFISRAVPENSSASQTLYIASGNTTEVEPVVGYEVASGEYNVTLDEEARTVGLSLDLSYVGNAYVTRTLVGKVSTKNASLNHPSFNEANEQALLRVTVTDFKAGVETPTIKTADPAAVLALTVSTGDIDEQQVISFSKTDGPTNNIDDVDQALLPGYVLVSGTTKLLILSKPFSLDNSTWGLLVHNLTETTGGALAGAKVYDSAKDVYILGYELVLSQAGVLEARADDYSYYALPNASYINEFTAQPIQGYMPLFVDQGGAYIEFKYQTVADAEDQTSAFPLKAEGFSTVATEGIQLLFNELGDTSTIPLLLGGQFNVPFAGGYLTVGSDTINSELAYSLGTSGRTVINDLYNAILSTSTFASLVEEVETYTTSFPYGLTIVSSLKGIEANRIKLKVIPHISGTQGAEHDFYYSIDSSPYAVIAAPAYKALSGGFDGPTYGERTLYSLKGLPLVQIVALSPGAQSIKFTVTPQSSVDKGVSRFVLTVQGTYSNQPLVESLVLDTRNVDPQTGLFLQSSDSVFIRAFFLPYLEYGSSNLTSDAINSIVNQAPLRAEPPLALYSQIFTGPYAIASYGSSVIKDLALVGGSDYTQDAPPLTANLIRKRAYLEAVKRLRGIDVAFVAITGISYGDPTYQEVFQEALNQVDEASAETGLRQLFLETPVGMPASQAESLAVSINRRYVTLVNGRVVQRFNNGSFSRPVGTLGFYTGLLAVRPPQISVHAPNAGQRLGSIASTTVRADKNYKTVITNGRVDSIFYDGGLKSYKFLNGLTTALEPTDRYVSVNRIRVQVISDLYDNLQWVRSLPNDRALQRQVTTAIGAYMQSKLQQGWFLRLGPVVCSAVNNSESDMIRGILNIEISYVPVVPADFINVNLFEDYSLIDTLTLNTAAG